MKRGIVADVGKVPPRQMVVPRGVEMEIDVIGSVLRFHFQGLQMRAGMFLVVAQIYSSAPIGAG